MPNAGCDSRVLSIYERLLSAYGPQGWWPLLPSDEAVTNVDIDGGWYHPGNYDIPRTGRERFEICLGTILTQNTTWRQACQALANLRQNDFWSPDRLIEAPLEQVAEAIRPSGYYIQKAKKLKEFSLFFSSLNEALPQRDALLQVWGIGPETSDSMLLYGWHQPAFVIDAYTRRLLNHWGLVPLSLGYEVARTYMENNLPQNVLIFQEFHALIIRHAKQHYSRRPYGVEDRLLAAL